MVSVRERWRHTCSALLFSGMRNPGRWAAATAYIMLLLLTLEGGDALAGSGSFSEACGIVVGKMLESSFGALIAAAAGLGAIIASAVGGFKSAWALLVVSIGCFILRALLTLTFDSGNCGSGLAVAPAPRPAGP